MTPRTIPVPLSDRIKAKRQKDSNFGRRTPTYLCIDCGKRTRETGEGESDCQMCLRCFTFAQIENAVSDGKYTAQEAQSEMDEFDSMHRKGKSK